MSVQANLISNNISVPEPTLTAQDLLRRAQAMRTALRERQAICENEGRIPEITQQEFVTAGFYRILQPRRFGGYEFELADYVRIMMEISRGCSESGWVLALTAGHPASFLSGFTEAAQCEAYGTTGHCIAPGVAIPGGFATAVPGGYRIKGAWDYCSGCDVATHFLGGMLTVDPVTQKPHTYIYVLVDRKDFSIVDNWDVIGMQGTGSKRVVVEDLVLPSYRVLEASDAEVKTWFPRPGHTLYENPLFRGPFIPLLMCELVAVISGAARGALDLYETSLLERKAPLPPFPFYYESPDYQHIFGQVQGLVDATEALALRMASDYTDMAVHHMQEGSTSPEAEARFLRVGQQCAELAAEAVDIMFQTSRTSATKKSSMLGRYFRNLSVIRTHVLLQSHRTATNAGRLRLGLPALSPI